MSLERSYVNTITVKSIHFAANHQKKSLIICATALSSPATQSSLINVKYFLVIVANTPAIIYNHLCSLVLLNLVSNRATTSQNNIHVSRGEQASENGQLANEFEMGHGKFDNRFEMWIKAEKRSEMRDKKLIVIILWGEKQREQQ